MSDIIRYMGFRSLLRRGFEREKERKKVRENSVRGGSWVEDLVFFHLFRGIYSMAKCHGCTLVLNQSYWFEILQRVIKSFEGWGQVIIFLLLELTLLVFIVSISSVYKSL